MVLSNVMFYVSELKLWRNRNCQGDFLLLFVFVFCKVMFLVGQGLASFLSVFFFFSVFNSLEREYAKASEA